MSGNEKKHGGTEPGAVRQAPRRRKPPRSRYAPADDALPGRLLILLSQLHRRPDAPPASEER